MAGGPFRPSTISCKTRKIARIREEKGRRWAGCLRLRDRACLRVEGGWGADSAPPRQTRRIADTDPNTRTAPGI